ncbi:hypothetical protein SDC9_181084 [bioreactor metagenome]|uniref:Uncharacterized protein n=1 Tax=bioreactor metagenome TaxID=1076179 RepID=A0A645H3I4_9ZZZZ
MYVIKAVADGCIAADKADDAAHIACSAYRSVTHTNFVNNQAHTRKLADHTARIIAGSGEGAGVLQKAGTGYLHISFS